VSDLNRYYKRIRLALHIDEADVVEICALGGKRITKSRCEMWGKATDSPKFREMTPDEMDAFTKGLVQWFDQQVAI